jgi:DNA-binding NarL/FixJ family response regulator
MLKKILVYGILLAISTLILNSLEYLFWLRLHIVEIYIGLVALIFLVLGIYFGQKPNKKTSISTGFTPQINTENNLGISKRELEVLILVNQGLTNQQIADSLFVSNNTIKTHTAHLFEKLQVSNRTQALAKAREIGLIF